jgi:hypothetical protein
VKTGSRERLPRDDSAPVGGNGTHSMITARLDTYAERRGRLI